MLNLACVVSGGWQKALYFRFTDAPLARVGSCPTSAVVDCWYIFFAICVDDASPSPPRLSVPCLSGAHFGYVFSSRIDDRPSWVKTAEIKSRKKEVAEDNLQ